MKMPALTAVGKADVGKELNFIQMEGEVFEDTVCIPEGRLESISDTIMLSLRAKLLRNL